MTVGGCETKKVISEQTYDLKLRTGNETEHIVCVAISNGSSRAQDERRMETHAKVES